MRLKDLRKLYRIALNPRNIVCNVKYLFIFSHMRSRSSLLSHILGSNPEICGYSELHHSYPGRMSLVKLRIDLNYDLKCRLDDKYLLDKLLYNDACVSDKVVESASPKAVILLREPDSTIKSIINMGHITGVEWYKDPVKGVQYYCSRLAGLEKEADRLRGNYFFIESDDLIENTDGVLDSLSDWLNLDEPLDKEYTIFRNTGKPGAGDPSHNIKSGTINKTKGYPDIQIPPDVLQKGQSAYTKCKETLMQWAENRVNRTCIPA